MFIPCTYSHPCLSHVAIASYLTVLTEDLLSLKYTNIRAFAGDWPGPHSHLGLGRLWAAGVRCAPPPAGPGAGLGVSRCIRSISEVFRAPGWEPETALGPTGTLSFPPGRVHGMGVTRVSAACLHPPHRVHGSQRTSPVSKQLRITSKGGKNKEMLQPERSWRLAPICPPLIFLDGDGAKPATKPGR